MVYVTSSRVNVVSGLSEPVFGSMYPSPHMCVPAVSVAAQTSWLVGVRTPGTPSAEVLSGCAPGRS